MLIPFLLLQGGVLFAGNAVDSAVETEPSIPEAQIAAYCKARTIPLHSRKGAPYTLFLDFSGHTATTSKWNEINPTGHPIDVYTVSPFLLDADSTRLSETELCAIATIYNVVSEDFLPFDLDVTLEMPANDDCTGNRVQRVCIGGDCTEIFGEKSNTDAISMNGKPDEKGFGFAELNFRDGKPIDTPIFVFQNRKKWKNSPHQIAPHVLGAKVSHETGHCLGLKHDGIKPGSPEADAIEKQQYRELFDHAVAQGAPEKGAHRYAMRNLPQFAAMACEYYGGDAQNAPIMGRPYRTGHVIWSRGDYPGASNTEDDLALIAAKIGIASDDFPDTPETAQNVRQRDLINGLSGSIGLKPDGKEDIDCLCFTVEQGGFYTFTVETDSSCTNLTPHITLQNQTGKIIPASEQIPFKTGERYTLILRAENATYGNLGAYTVRLSPCVTPPDVKVDTDIVTTDVSPVSPDAASTAVKAH